MSGPPRKRRSRPRVTTPGPATNARTTSTSRDQAADHAQRKAVTSVLQLPDVVPVALDVCPDCAAIVEETDNGPRLVHKDGCPIASGLDVDEIDRVWFLEHPYANRYRREAKPAEVLAIRLQGIDLGEPARVEVTQIEPGLRVRSFSAFGQLTGMSIDTDGPGREFIKREIE